MPKVMADGLQGFGHVCFYREPGNIQLFGDGLMAQALHFCKPEYLFLLWRQLVYRFTKKFLILFFNHGIVRAVHVQNTMSKFPFGSCFFRHFLNSIENPVARHRKEVPFKTGYPDQVLTPHPYL